MKENPKNKPNFFEQRGAASTPPPGGKVLLPGGAGGRAKKFTDKGKFNEIKRKFEELGKLDLYDFNNTADLGAFLDWYNLSISSSKEKSFNNDVLEISKYLVRSMGRKHFRIKSDV